MAGSLGHDATVQAHRNDNVTGTSKSHYHVTFPMQWKDVSKNCTGHAMASI